MTREEIEAKSNWVATFLVTRRNKCDCLMSNVVGGFYWEHADYEGLFSYGATRPYVETLFRVSEELGYVQFVKGTHPLTKEQKNA